MNLEEETRCGYLITAKMKSVWNIQIDLVQKLLEVCKKYDLRIWADSGTLIGTIRDKGYIPWDDDIDLVMMRDDYDKLLAVSNAEFKSPYFFQTAYSEHAPYSHGHAQLRMNGTTAILHGNEHMNIHLGIFIDIFVLDNVIIIVAAKIDITIIVITSTISEIAFFFSIFSYSSSFFFFFYA